VPAKHPGLGESVKQFESQNGGVGTVSVPDPKDKGGVSYGTYQLASNTNTAQDFVDSPEGKSFKNDFAGLKPGSPAFSAKWKEAASRDPEGLHRAEREYIYRTHYKPQAVRAAEKGYDMGNPAIQDAVWSGSLQHGNFDRVLEATAKRNDLRSMSDEDQLKALYEARGAYTDNLKTVPKSSGRSRYDKELPTVLERNKAYQDRMQRASYLWGDLFPR